MTKTRMAALLVALGLLAAGCGADDPDADSGSPQADGGGCADHTRTDDAAWQPARYAQDDDWQPPAEPVAVGEGLAVGDWTITVIDIKTNAADEMEAALAELGGTPPADYAWIVVQATLTNDGAEIADPSKELESRYVDRHGDIHVDYSPCAKSEDIGIDPGETTIGLSLVPVPPELVDGGYWGIGVGDPDLDDLVFVR